MKKRILLVEDDPSVRKVTKLRLEHEGFEVRLACDGEEALQRASTEGPLDLILLDLRMPRMDGFEVCKRLKEGRSTQQIPVIVLSATDSYLRELIDRCLELGISGWIRKPYHSRELMEKIHHVLRISSAGTETA